MTVRCHACGHATDADRVGVRDVCARCNAWLHCCRSCTLYEPGLHNDCREPTAETVADKTAGNFCEHFRPSSAASPPAEDAGGARAALERLFRKPG